MTGTKGHSGRKRRPTAQRYGETWVRLDWIQSASVNGVTWRRDYYKTIGIPLEIYVDGIRFINYAAAAAEFVRRVNAK